MTAAAEVAWSVTESARNVLEVRIVPREPSTVRVGWQLPCVDVTAFWTPDSGEHRGLPPFWRRPRTTSLATGAPMGSLPVAVPAAGTARLEPELQAVTVPTGGLLTLT